MKTVACGVCDAKKNYESETNLSLGAILEKTGYHFVFDISNGLETIYLCPFCTERVAVHIRGLKEIFGEKLSAINFASFIKEV